MKDNSIEEAAEQILGSDYALCRVPRHARYSWPSMALEQMAQGGCIANVVLGAEIGHKMTSTDALLAVLLGNLILALMGLVLGMIGCREGMTTSMLGRWTGLGVVGTGLLSLITTGSLFGWFGIQAAIAGDGLEAIGRLGYAWTWTLANGALVTFVVVFGFRWMVGASWITGPIFLVVVIWACVVALQDSGHKKQDLELSELSLLHGTGIVVGGWVVGTTIASDVFRFARSKRQAASLVALPRSCSLAVYMVAGVLLSQAYGTDDVITIMHESVGLGAVVVVVAGEMVINCTNIYSASLAIVALIDTVFGWQIPRPAVTVACGTVGSALGACGILRGFIPFLDLLSVTFPPAAGIICCEYLVVKGFRSQLDETRASGTMPETAPVCVPASLVAWLAAALLGHFLPWGMPYLYSLFGAALFYGLLSITGLRPSYGSMKIGSARSSTKL